MNVVRKDFHADIIPAFWSRIFKGLQSFKCCLIFTVGCVFLYILKYKAGLDSGHVTRFKMKLFVTKAITAKGSTLDVPRVPGYTSDGFLNPFFENLVEQKN